MLSQDLMLGLLLASAVSWLAFRAGTLTLSGAAAATIVGASVFAFGGLKAALLLILFFVSSSGLTRFKAGQKERLRLGFAKGGRRDAWQVIANGGVAALGTMVFYLNGSRAALAGFIGALAAAAADTWGTELGVLSSEQPRSLLTGRSVPRGTSGAVSALGIRASLLGSLVVGALGYAVLADWRVIPIVMIGGVIGATLDSLLGAYFQVMYACPACEAATESHPLHHCGSPTLYQRGWRWLNNDGVNFLATLGGAAVSAWLATLWFTT